MKAYIFPGQGAQFTGMGKDLYDQFPVAKEMFEKANEILGFPITQVMFEGSEEDLKETKITQPAIFLHSVIAFKVLSEGQPDMVGGHSLGEFSALVANGSLDFESALVLVSKRAQAMQKACEKNPSTMAVILGLEDEKVEEICKSIHNEIVVPANYNCPGQLVISGSFKGIELACEAMKAAGAKRALPLKVGGAFHSPLMLPAQEELAEAIEKTQFSAPLCPIYQNFTAQAAIQPEEIKKNLVSQLTAPVLWTKTVQNMVKEGAAEFVEFGPGEVLQGLVKKIENTVQVSGKK